MTDAYATVATPARADLGLQGRLSWITGLRLGFLVLLLTATLGLYLRGSLSQYNESMTVVTSTIGAGFVMAMGYALTLRSRKRLRELSYAQLALDQLTWSAIVYVSGGPTSGATSFYGLTCLVGAVLLGARGAAFAALTGVVAYITMSVSFVVGVLQPPRDQLNIGYVTHWEGLSFPVLVNLLGLAVVALLAGYLAERLRRAGGALQAAEARVEQAERLAMIGRLAAGLAHEIRNPLGSIRGSIEMLKEAPGLEDDDRRLCDIVLSEAERLNDLVGDMMDLARPRPPSPTTVDVAGLARSVVDLAARSARGAGDVHVVFETSAERLLAVCDASQMKQVLWNLVRNGVQATPAGGRVLVKVSDEGGEVRLVVLDQGPGVSDEAKARIFDAFYTTRSHGTGMGLAVVKRIVDEHAAVGASIEVRSPGGEAGAEFAVSLRKAT
jgi:two-component system, NtrC family, sensor histidine kinase HydH